MRYTNHELRTMNNELLVSIENPTLVHFRHFRHFSSLLTNLSSTTVEDSLQINPFYAKQTQFPKKSNERNFLSNNELRTKNYEQRTKKQTQYKPNSKQILIIPNSHIYPMYHQRTTNNEQRTTNNEQRTNNKQTQFQNRILFDDYPFILYTGVLYKNKPNMDKK
jgi:hypothetical protein